MEEIRKRIGELVNRAEFIERRKVSLEMEEHYSPERLAVEKNKILRGAVGSSANKILAKLTKEEERNEMSFSQEMTLTGYIFNKNDMVELLNTIEALIINEEERNGRELSSNTGTGDSNPEAQASVSGTESTGETVVSASSKRGRPKSDPKSSSK